MTPVCIRCLKFHTNTAQREFSITCYLTVFPMKFYVCKIYIVVKKTNVASVIRLRFLRIKDLMKTGSLFSRQMTLKVKKNLCLQFLFPKK